MRWKSVVWLVAGLVLAIGGGAVVAAEDKPKGQEKQEDKFPPPDTTWPTRPGVHHLSYEHEQGDRKRMLTYGLFLPPEIETAAMERRKLPVVVFLCGLGSRGQTRDKLFREGPLNGMRRSEDFKKAMDYIVVAPQVPRDARWENRFMGTFVAEITRRVRANYPVDPDRVHLIGMSMGGEGVWHAAMGGPELWATVVCIGGRKHPEPAKVAEALKDKTTLIIVGSGDEEFTTGSQVMAEAFKAVEADALHVEIPGRGHDIWGFYVPRKRMYDWMLEHRRGEAPPKDRADAEALLAWAMNPPEDPAYYAFADELQKEFETFKPYWFIDNCAKTERVGLTESALGKENVFITEPLNHHIGARIMHTAQIPEGKRTTLHLTVGHEPGGRWRLTVNVAAHRKLREDVVHKGEDKDRRWSQYEVDLTPYAGQEVFIEILNKARGRQGNTAYWHRIDIVSEAPAGEAKGE